MNLTIPLSALTPLSSLSRVDHVPDRGGWSMTAPLPSICPSFSIGCQRVENAVSGRIAIVNHGYRHR